MEEISTSEIDEISGGFRGLVVRIAVTMIYDGIGSYARFLKNSGSGNGIEMSDQMTAMNGGNLGA